MSDISTRTILGRDGASAVFGYKLLSEETMEICAPGHDIAAHAPGTWIVTWV